MRCLTIAEEMTLKRSGMIHKAQVAKLLGIKVKTLENYVMIPRNTPKDFPLPDFRRGVRNLWWKKERIDNYLKEKQCKSHTPE